MYGELRMKKIFMIFLIPSVLFSAGCAAGRVAIEKRNLDVQTKMSDTVFLEPVRDDLKTVYVEVRNTSDKDINVSDQIKSMVQQHGYRLVTDPDKAHYLLQANILQAGKIDPSAASTALSNGFGGAVLGGLAGGAATHRRGGVVAGAVVGGLAEMVTNSMVKDVTYSLITDLQISERAKGRVREETESHLSQGSQSTVHQSEETDSNWKKYRTRILSSANKVNLEFEVALPELEKGLIRSISGIF